MLPCNFVWRSQPAQNLRPGSALETLAADLVGFLAGIISIAFASQLKAYELPVHAQMANQVPVSAGYAPLCRRHCVSVPSYLPAFEKRRILLTEQGHSLSEFVTISPKNPLIFLKIWAVQP